jgi:hypothetical protein
MEGSSEELSLAKAKVLKDNTKKQISKKVANLGSVLIWKGEFL